MISEKPSLGNCTSCILHLPSTRLDAAREAHVHSVGSIDRAQNSSTNADISIFRPDANREFVLLRHTDVRLWSRLCDHPERFPVDPGGCPSVHFLPKG